MCPPAIISVTAAIIISIPHNIRGVNASPNTVTPIITAVTGSNAPRIAVGVDPIYCMALVVQRNDIAVGKMARAMRFPHIYHFCGMVTACPKSRRMRNSDTPNKRI